MSTKPTLLTLTRDHAGTPEGKYLIQRRDGTVPPWPSFVLGGADPVAAVALRAYATEIDRLLRCDPVVAQGLGLTGEFAQAVSRWADEFDRWRLEHGSGDPGKGPHRKDDSAIIALMDRTDS